MKVLDLFSGIGGFSLGLERAGFETVAFCEVDKHAQKVLKKHWPEVPIHNDVRELDGKQYRGSVDVVCGGYPCQPFSIAGKQQGADDERHLWPEMLRIIRDCRPSWVIAENVIGHIKLGIDNVYADLEREGYTTGSICIPACATGKDHQRERVWVLANTTSNGCNGREISRGDAEIDERSTERENKIKHAERCSSLRLEMDWRSYQAERGRTKPRICRVDDGLSAGMDRARKERIKQLGNAVVPQIPEAIGRAIIEFEKRAVS